MSLARHRYVVSASPRPSSTSRSSSSSARTGTSRREDSLHERPLGVVVTPLLRNPRPPSRIAAGLDPSDRSRKTPAESETKRRGTLTPMVRAVATLSGAVSVALLIAPVVSAQEATDDAQAAAAAGYEEGVGHYREGRFEPALRALEASHAAFASPNSMLYIARCQRELGRIGDALGSYERANRRSRRFAVRRDPFGGGRREGPARVSGRMAADRFGGGAILASDRARWT